MIILAAIHRVWSGARIKKTKYIPAEIKRNFANNGKTLSSRRRIRKAEYTAKTKNRMTGNAITSVCVIMNAFPFLLLEIYYIKTKYYVSFTNVFYKKELCFQIGMRRLLC
jgi:hypothetical protein